MNRQRKVVITITYNEMGIIIDTKAEEVAQPNLQSTCNELVTDCISRQAALDALGEEPYVWTEDDDYERGMRFQWKSDHDAIEALPSAQPKREKGKWIDETFKPWGLVYHPYKCDQCGEHSEADSNFCPNCGADMRGEQDE